MMVNRFFVTMAMALAACAPLAAAQSPAPRGSDAGQLPLDPANEPVAGKGVLALAGRLDLQIDASKPSFAVNEAITVQLALNRAAFIYLYSNEADGTSRLLYPYAAGGRAKVERRTRFLNHKLISDRPGQISIIAFASDTPLALAGGDASLRGAPTKDWEDMLAKRGVNVGSKIGADAVPGISTPKALTLWVGVRNGQNLNAPASEPDRVRPDAVITAAEKPDTVVTAADKPGAGAVAPQTPAAETLTGVTRNRVAKVATDKTAYKLGDNVNVAVALDQPGWAHLFVAYPSGQVEELTKRRFEEPGTVIVQAVATAPVGEQVVVAVYSVDGKIDSAQVQAAIKVAPKGYASKGLSLRDGSGTELQVSVSSFKIEE